MAAYEKTENLSRKDRCADLNYEPPKTGLLSIVPSWLVPYGELMRLHKPAGYYTFLFPHVYGTLLGALLAQDVPQPLELLYTNLVFTVGSVFLRGAACTWNDAIDAPLDRQVLRCCTRPCARGAVSIREAVIFTIIQSVFGSSLLFLLPGLCRLYAIPFILLLGFYAFAKRFTNYPQIVLGFTLAIGQWIGAAAVGVDVFSPENRQYLPATMCLYLANVLSAIIVDAVYSHQDLKDDLKAGVKSIAVAWQDQTRPLLWLLSVIQVIFLAIFGSLLDLGLSYNLVAVGGIGVMNIAMVSTVRLDVAESCWWWFVNSIYLTGILLGGGMGMKYLKSLP